jgi:hypothetical protein
MIETLHFKKGVKGIKLNATVTNLNVLGNFVCLYRRDDNTEKNHLTG